MTDELIKRINVTESENCPLTNAVFGLWEDLCGPSVKCRFSSTGDTLSMENARSLVKIALSYHLKEPSKFNHFNVCDYGDLEMSGLNCVYTAPVRRKQAMFCILAVFPRSYYHRLKTFTSLLATFWQEKMDALKVHHKIAGDLVEVVGRISTYLSVFCNLLKQLEMNMLSPMLTRMPESIKLSDTFVQRCIASHLITFGRSLVLGESINCVNDMIDVLTFFSLPHRRDLCVRVPSKITERLFHAELFVQGDVWIANEDQQYPVSVWDILKVKYPITIINVSTLEVQCSVPLLLHQKRRDVYMSTSILRYLKDSGDFDDVFQSVEEVVVEDLITDGHVISHELEKVCADVVEMNGMPQQIEAAINLFIRQILIKAKMLISYTNTWEKKRDGLISKRSLWSILKVCCEGDYQIVLAFAEQLRPGLIDLLDGGIESHL